MSRTDWISRVVALAGIAVLASCGTAGEAATTPDEGIAMPDDTGSDVADAAVSGEDAGPETAGEPAPEVAEESGPEMAEEAGPEWVDSAESAGESGPEVAEWVEVPAEIACQPQCAGKVCGDNGCGGTCGDCDAGTTCQGGACVVACGDGQCGAGEDQCNCPADCVSGCSGCCQAGACADGTANDACGGDGGACLSCSGGRTCQGQACVYSCGDLVCAADGGEDCGTCPQDCGSCCGNGACDHGELCGTCPQDCCSPTPGFVKIAAGSFWMGSPGGCPGPVGYPGDCTEEYGRTPGGFMEEILHYVQFTHDIEVRATEVTQGDWKAEFGGWNPSATPDCGDSCPVETVTWYDALAYADRKSVEAGLSPCYALAQVTCQDGSLWYSDYGKCMTAARGGLKSAIVTLPAGVDKPYDCTGYRLPTEAEWEYAARAGTLGAFNDGGGLDAGHANCQYPFHLADIAWYCGDTGGDSPYTIMPVATKAPNAWGLFDMAGNVSEWVWDIDAYYGAGTPSSPSVDPVNPSGGGGTEQMFRGGSWASNAWECRSAYRFFAFPDSGYSSLGVRLARTL